MCYTSQAQLHSRFSPSSPEQCRGTGNGGYGQFITRCLCCFFLLRGRTPHTITLLHCEVPLTGDSSPQTPPTRVLPAGCSSSQTAPTWFLPTGCCPSGTGCSSVGPRGVTSPASKPVLAGAPLSTGPQVLAGACSSVGSPWAHSLLQASTCSGVGSLLWATGGYLLCCVPPWTAGGQPASSWSSLWAAGESLLQQLEHLLPLLLH